MIWKHIVMSFNNEEFRNLRLKNRITSSYIAQRLCVTRKTIYNWENGNSIPKREQIVKLAKLFKVRVHDLTSKIDLMSETKSFLDMATQNWMSIFNQNEQYKKEIIHVSNLISELSDKLNSATKLISGITESIHFPLYIKNSGNKYIMANKALLKYFSLPKDFDYNSKTDSDFMPQNEAVENNKEDLFILDTAESIVNREGFIPGTRKSKTGLITKVPIINKNGNIVGLIGFFLDITERKKNEASRLILEKVLDNLDLSIVILKKSPEPHATYTVIYVNKYLKIRYPWLESYDNESIFEEWKKRMPVHTARMLEQLESSNVFPINYKYAGINRITNEKTWFSENIYMPLDNYYMVTTFAVTELNRLQQFDDFFISNVISKSDNFSWTGYLKKDKSDIIIERINNSTHELNPENLTFKQFIPENEHISVDLWLKAIKICPVLKHKFIKNDGTVISCETRIITQNDIESGTEIYNGYTTSQIIDKLDKKSLLNTPEYQTELQHKLFQTND